jgi:hypothetical protein
MDMMPWRCSISVEQNLNIWPIEERERFLLFGGDKKQEKHVKIA